MLFKYTASGIYFKVLIPELLFFIDELLILKKLLRYGNVEVFIITTISMKIRV